ncbi:MAG: GGDEF domain-containing protein [Acidobacteria bacterium]|nr:MAG: GGDEF domain-containing protein [Acidobacteriota bacterium]
MRAAETTPERRMAPRDRSELEAWIRSRLALSAERERELLDAIGLVLDRQHRMWQESKDEAIRAIAAGFTEKLARLREELSARNATVSSIGQYFESLVAELTERSHRDPKTKLMNFDWFMSQLESFLEIEQRVRWCAIGLADIHGFKQYNDVLGHAVGDRIIERVARLLAEQIRSDDLIAQDDPRSRRPEMHARFGGDEFCFLIPDLGEGAQARAVADRFRRAVDGYDWSQVDRRLADQPVRVDVGVVCLWMGRPSERRFAARRLALELVDQADKLMYDAKGDEAGDVRILRVRIEDGHLARYGAKKEDRHL